MRFFQTTVSTGANGTPPGEGTQGTVLLSKHRSLEIPFVAIKSDFVDLLFTPERPGKRPSLPIQRIKIK